jgi:hypothetical protein
MKTLAPTPGHLPRGAARAAHENSGTYPAHLPRADTAWAPSWGVFLASGWLGKGLFAVTLGRLYRAGGLWHPTLA